MLAVTEIALQANDIYVCTSCMHEVHTLKALREVLLSASLECLPSVSRYNTELVQLYNFSI